MARSQAPVEPRTRANALRRGKITCTTTVGKNSMPLTCPRCGWPCTHLVIPYYDSPWIQYGGVCCECCQEAAAHFDQVGWPPDPDM
jgi:hypothetical protein